MLCRFAMGLALLCGASAVALAQGTPSASLKSVEVQGTEFKVTLTDGRVLRSRELVGTARDRDGRAGGPRTHRRGRARSGREERRGLVCTRSRPSWLTARGRTCAMRVRMDGARDFPFAGRPRADGMLEPAEPGIFELACTAARSASASGSAIRPWAFAQGPELRDVYNACIRMVRADYCGDGNATTRRAGRSTSTTTSASRSPRTDPAMEFEAGWTAEGAACVRHTRVKENITLEALVAACPG